MQIQPSLAPQPLKPAFFWPFLFFSGLCALIYQVCWLREFRLIFGASTSASAAVVAIFIGGLGAGGIIIGRRADRDPKPLALYAKLEIAIAIAAALSPLFLTLIRWLYLSLGGTATLGMAGGTILRLVLAAVVLGVPTFLMGGTLPAIVRALVSEDDRGRRLVAWLYAVNTLGAVAGSALATFYLIEQNGTRMTLWLATAVNLALGLGLWLFAKNHETAAAAPTTPSTETPAASAIDIDAAPTWFVLLAAAVVGFAFFLMEIVWYRMLSPILGGSVFTFGLILTLILLGIGVGGLLYAIFSRSRPAKLSGFALTCLLEAAFVMLGFAMGDRLAFIAVSLQSFSVFGFSGLVIGWTVIAAIATLPGAIVAGYQFPLLIALLGKGSKDIGRHIGAAYAWNTGGAILGSLAGGFLLLPILSATGTWRLVGLLLVILGVAAVVLCLKHAKNWGFSAAAPIVMAIICMALIFAPEGPTAAWRHSGIGVGRVNYGPSPTANEYRNWRNNHRGWIIHEIDGVESCIGIEARDGLAFILNGKTDGNAYGDAATQVMSGMVGGILHPSPKSALVVGLGTGSTAGWLGVIPSMERVDAIELEPAVLEYAKLCDLVNAGCMNNPKVHIAIGDAREHLMTAKRKYDLVVSEPSNPYRAGIASLFTREYYQSVASKLEDSGIFIQWCQSYDVQPATLQTIYATLLSVFPNVETWQCASGDMLLVASAKPIDHDINALTRRINQEPFRTAIVGTWRTNSIEGFYAHFIASSAFSKSFINFPGVKLNTDDRTVIEFGFARSINTSTRFSINEFRAAAKAMNQHRPAHRNGPVDWDRVEEEMAQFKAFDDIPPPLQYARGPEQQQRAIAMRKYFEGDFAGALAAWNTQLLEPRSIMEIAMVAECMAGAGDERAVRWINQLREYQQVEADAILARLRLRQGKPAESAAAMVSAFNRFQKDPWPMRLTMRRAIPLSVTLCRGNPELAKSIYAALKTPFAVRAHDEPRRIALLEVAKLTGDPALVIESMQSYEPFVPWHQDYLVERLDFYARAKHPLRARAFEDLTEFQKAHADNPLRELMVKAAQSQQNGATAQIEK